MLTNKVVYETKINNHDFCTIMDNHTSFDDAIFYFDGAKQHIVNMKEKNAAEAERLAEESAEEVVEEVEDAEKE